MHVGETKSIVSSNLTNPLFVSFPIPESGIYDGRSVMSHFTCVEIS